MAQVIINGKAYGLRFDLGALETVETEFLTGEFLFFEEFDGNPDDKEEGEGVDESVGDGRPDGSGEEVATEEEVKSESDGVFDGDDDDGNPEEESGDGESEAPK